MDQGQQCPRGSMLGAEASGHMPPASGERSGGWLDGPRRGWGEREQWSRGSNVQGEACWVLVDLAQAQLVVWVPGRWCVTPLSLALC